MSGPMPFCLTEQENLVQLPAFMFGKTGPEKPRDLAKVTLAVTGAAGGQSQPQMPRLGPLHSGDNGTSQSVRMRVTGGNTNRALTMDQALF